MASQKKSHNYCSVFGCKTKYSSSDYISFHSFPSTKEPKVLWRNKNGVEELNNRHKIWAMVLRMGKETLNKKQLKICSLHFTNEDFKSGGMSYQIIHQYLVIWSHMFFNQ